MMRTCRESATGYQECQQCGQGQNEEISYLHLPVCSLHPDKWWDAEDGPSPWEWEAPCMKEDRLPVVGVAACLVILIMFVLTIGGCIGYIIAEGLK